MSHIVRVKDVKMTDAVAREMAVQRMDKVHFCLNDKNNTVVDAPHEGEYKMYGNQKASGIGIKIDGWAHPVVITPDTGAAQFDSYGCNLRQRSCSWRKPGARRCSPRIAD